MGKKVGKKMRHICVFIKNHHVFLRFDFDEADVPHHNDGMHDDHEGSIGGPPFETLHIGQGFCFDHNVLPANEPTHVQQDPLPTRVYTEFIDASLISNHRIEVQTSKVIKMPTILCSSRNCIHLYDASACTMSTSSSHSKYCQYF